MHFSGNFYAVVVLCYYSFVIENIQSFSLFKFYNVIKFKHDTVHIKARLDEMLKFMKIASDYEKSIFQIYLLLSKQFV